MSDSIEAELLADLARLSSDPLGFVLWAFPWGEPDSELADRDGPYEWQKDILRSIGSGLISLEEAIRIAVASGHGIGKSALVSWIILWGISTMEDTKGVVTANTETQLKTKTWAELGKWYRLFIAKQFFILTATAIYSRDPEHERTWRIDMVPWTEKKPESFAGLHNAGRRIILIFDEASAIGDVIWEVSEGALTDKNTQIIWPCFGNPTSNKGRFKKCFTEYQHRWNTRQIDSRDVPGTNLVQIAAWEKDYGEDSDFFRVRVRGLFPNAASIQLIAESTVESARTIQPLASISDPLIFGLDVARFGDNESVLVRRCGRDARTRPALRWRGLSVDVLADKVASLIAAESPDAVFVDEGGVGGGVVDCIRRLGFECIGVNFGGKPGEMPNGTNVANKSAEMWVKTDQWMKSGGAIEDSEELSAQLLSRGYSFNKKQQMQLDSKEDMRARGEDSPDWADGLVLTFAYPVAKKSRRQRETKMDYDPQEWEPPKEPRFRTYAEMMN